MIIFKNLKPVIPKVLFFCLLFSLGFSSLVSASQFPVSKIDDDLKKNANAIIRLNKMDVVFDKPSRYTVERKIVVTILNENGKGPDIFAEQYDLYSSIKFNGGHIYDEKGESIRKIKKKDLIDRSNVANFSLYEDNRILAYVPNLSEYPYTVEYSWQVSYKRGMYYSSGFYTVPAFNISTEKASLNISCTPEMDIKFMLFNVDKDSEESIGRKEYKKYLWEFENIKAIKKEYLSPSIREFVPVVLFTPSHFQFDNYAGTTSSWKEFGKWAWELNQGRDDLPKERTEFLQNLVKDAPDQRDKVKRIYQYLQDNTRYVNIALGIGGMQPFDAKTVDNTGYGDCKALTNYTKAMLRAVGIKAYYTLVYAGAGRYNILEDFPTNQFNHVILCVPLEKDTVWLECTNQQMPFDHLGDFTDNRPVLLIKEDGGYLTKTPGYDPLDNINNINATIVIDKMGNGTGNITMQYGGIYFVDYYPVVRLAPDDQKKWLYNRFHLPNYTIDQYNLSAITDTVKPTTGIEMDVSLRSYGSVSGNRIHVPLNPISSRQYIPKRERNRISSFVLKYEKTVSDTLVFHIPEGYVLESPAPEYHKETSFGTYTTRFVRKDGEFVYIRDLQTYRGNFPAERYKEFYDFHQNIDRFEGQTLTFVKE
ncbi:MAG: DUF3857 domain-containing protein [Bacteroidota bacterium]